MAYRSLLPEAELRLKKIARIAATSEAAAGTTNTPATRDLFAEEQKLLDAMTEIAESTGRLQDARVKALIEWIRRSMCQKYFGAEREME